MVDEETAYKLRPILLEFLEMNIVGMKAQDPSIGMQAVNKAMSRIDEVYKDKEDE